MKKCSSVLMAGASLDVYPAQAANCCCWLKHFIALYTTLSNKALNIP